MSQPQRLRHPAAPTEPNRVQLGPRPPSGSARDRCPRRGDPDLLVLPVVAPAFRSAESISTVLYQSSIIAIMAVAVGLLMIGGEFDLSAGATGHHRPDSRDAHDTSSAPTSGSPCSSSLVVGLAIGFLNGCLVMRTGTAELHRHAGHVLRAPGHQPRGDQAVIRPGVGPRTSGHGRLRLGPRRSSPRRFDLGGVDGARSTVVWWLAVRRRCATWVLLRTRVGNWIFAVGGAPAAPGRSACRCSGPRSACS